MSDISNLRDTIIPKSDQINAEQLIGAPLTIRVTSVSRGTPDQPITIGYAGDNGRPYKPCKTMRKVLIFAWGDDGNAWIGKSMTIFCDPEVKWAGVKVGGIRISHLSHIDRDISVSLSVTRGKKEPVIIKKLAQQTPEYDIESYRESVLSMIPNGVESCQTAMQALPAPVKKALGKAFYDSTMEAAKQAESTQNHPEPENEGDIF